MIPLVIVVKDKPLYFTYVMHPADELEVGKMVIFSLKDNALTFYQLEESIGSLNVTENQIQKASRQQGQMGMVKVIDIRPDRFIFDNSGKEMMVFSLLNGSIKAVEFQPRSDVLAMLNKESK